MSNTDFNIIVGADTSKAESSIKELSDSVSQSYSVQVKAVFENRSKFVSDIKRLKSMLDTLSSVNVDVNMSGFKNAEGSSNKLGKNLEALSGEAENLESNLLDAIKAQEKLMKTSEKVTDKARTVTTKKGNDIVSTTEKEVNKTPTMKEIVKDFTKLEKYSDSISKKIAEWKENGNLAKNEIKEFEKLTKQLSVKNLEKDPTGFSDNYQNIKKQLSELEKEDKRIADQRLEAEKNLNLISKERSNWEKKIQDLESKGYTHASQMKALKTLLNNLDVENLTTLSKTEKALEKINAQYARAVVYQENSIASSKAKNKAEDFRIKAENNLDPELIGNRSFNALSRNIDKIVDVKTVEDYNNAVRKVVVTYNELINKQKQAIEQKKLEVLQEKEHEKVLQHLADMERKTIEEQTRLSNEENERKAKQWEEEQRIANEIADGRAKVENKKLNESLKDAENQAKKSNEEQVRLYENQQKINESFKEFDDIIDGFRKNDLFDESDLNGAWDLIDNLSNESKELKTDLNAVYKELKKVGDELDKRENKQLDVDILNTKNQNNANKMNDRGIVPEHLINNFKQLSNTLSFESNKEDLAKVASQYQELIELEKQLKNESKETERYKKLIYEAEKRLVKVTDSHQEKLDNILSKSKQQLESSKRVADVEYEVAKALNMIEESRRKGVVLSSKDEQAILKQVKSVEELAKSYKELESEEDRRERKIQQIGEKSESVFYRSSRGLNKNIKELREVQKLIDEIRNQRDEELIDLTGKDFDRKYREIEEKLVNLSQRSRELRDDARENENSFFGRFAYAMQSVPVWISAMTVFYGTMAQVRLGFESIVEIDGAMINLQKVTEATNAEMEEFKHHASEIGFNLGVTTAEVINATTEFQKLGYSIEQATALAKNSVLYANVGDMDIDTATQSIVSAVKGFDIDVDDRGENILRMVDMFNQVSNEFAISSEGIGTALQRSSAVLNQAGNSIEQSVAIVTAANTTIQDPLKVGNALKTITMRLRGMSEDGSSAVGLVSELDGAFKSLNENMTIMKDANTFKSTYEIMDMLAKEWDGLTDAQQAYMTELIGGKEQGAIVASMLQNWTDGVSAYETALNSAGSATREFQAYQDGFEYKINQLKVAMEEFWIALMNDDALKSAIEGLTSLVNLMTQLVEMVGSEAIATNLVALIALFGTSTLRNIFLDFSGQKDKMDDFKAGIKGMTDTTESVFQRLGGGLKGIIGISGMVLKRLIPILGVVTLLTTATSGFIDWIYRESNARKENISTLEDEIKKYETLKETMENASLDEYLALDSRYENLNTEELERHKQLQEEIKNQMPELVSYYDENGDAALRNADAIRKLVAEQERQYAQNRESLVNTKIEDADFSELQGEVDEINQMIRRASDAEEESQAFSFAKTWIEENLSELKNGGAELEGKLQELFDGFNEGIENNANKLDIQDTFFKNVATQLRNGNTDGTLAFLEKYGEELKNKTMKLNGEVDTARVNLTEKMSNFNVLLQDQVDNYLFKNNIEQNSNEALFIGQIRDKLEDDITELGEEDVKEVLNEFPKYVEETLKALDKTGVSIDDLMTLQEGDTKESVTKMFDDVSDKIKGMDLDNGQKIIDVLNNIRDTRIDDAMAVAEESVRSLGKAVSDVSTNLEDAQKDIAFINGMLEEYKENNSLSASSILEIVEEYPSLLGYMNNEAKLIEELKKLKEQDVEVAKKALAKKLEMNTQFYNQNIKALQSFVAQQFKFYQGDLTQFKNLAQAKADVETQLINKLANAWGVYFNKTLDSFSIYKSMSEWSQSSNSFGIDLEQVKKASKAQQELNKFRDTWDSFSLDRVSIDVGSIGMSAPKEDKKKDKKQKDSMQDAIYVADKFQQTMDLLNEKIARQQALQERYPKYSKEYKNALSQEILLNKQRKTAIDNEIKSLEKQIKARNIAKKGLININSGEDNRTARAKRAEIQQEIDEAQKRLDNLRTQSVQSQNEILNLIYSSIEGNLEYYKINRESLEDEIALMEYKMGLYEEGSSSFIQYSNDQIKYLKEQRSYQQKELEYLLNVKKARKDLTASQIESLNALIREARTSLLDMDESIADVQNSLASMEVTKLTENLEKEAERYAEEIEKIRDKIEYDLKDDGDYATRIDYLQDILSLTKGQVKEAETNIKQLEALKKQYYGNHEIVSQINDEIEGWEDSLVDSQREVKGLNKEIKTMYKDLGDEFVDLYVEQLELMKQAEEEKYEDTMELEQKAHDTRMKNLDDELEFIRKIYNDRMELIDREEATKSYNDDLQELQDDAKELQKTINELSLDDTFEAQAKRSDLTKQLADINKQIAERQHDREVELRKQNLEDDLETQEEALESKKTKYEEDYDAFVENEENKKEARDKYWEQQLNDEKMFAKIREQVMSGSFDNLTSMLQSWSSNISKEMSILGTTISDNFTSKVQDAVEELTKLKGLGSFEGVVSVGGTTPEKENVGGNTSRKKQLTEEDYKLLSGKFISSELKKFATNKSQEDILQQRASSLTREARENGAQLDPNITQSYDDLVKTLSEEEKILMAKYIKENTMQFIVSPHLREALVDLTNDIASNSRNFVGDVDLWSSESFLNALKQYINGFSSGGFTGKIGKSGRITKVHEDELILDKQNTATIKEYLGTDNLKSRFNQMLNPKAMAKSMIESIKTFAVNSIAPVDKSSNSESTTNVENHYNLTLKIDKFNGTKKESKIVGEQILNDIKRMQGGIY